MDINAKIENALESIRRITDFKPELALVLGSGLGGFTQHIDIVKTVPYSDIEGFPVSTVAGHSGQYVFGHVQGVPIVAMQGRIHFYEGYQMSDVVLPIRLMGLIGAKVLFLSNAAGGANKGYKPGTLMLIKDHVASFVPSPLLGANVENLGTRFPDMSNIYNVELRDIIKKTAKDLAVHLEEGVYVQFTGPQYESPAEIRMAQAFGADAVGMSTACEAIAANHMGMRICGISCITNMAAGLNETALNHKEVQETADRVAEEFQRLVKHSIINICNK